MTPLMEMLVRSCEKRIQTRISEKTTIKWLKEFGKEKLIGQVQSVITIMKLCTNMQDFTRKFAKVFNKTALQTTFEDINWNAAERTN